MNSGDQRRPDADAQTLRIRDAVIDDLAAILALYERSGIDEPGLNDLALARDHWPALQRAGAQVLIAEQVASAAVHGDPPRPVGTLTLYLLPLLGHAQAPSANVDDVAVDSDAQGLGVGRALMAEAARRAIAAGCYKLALSSNQRRKQAHAFYAALGYTQHGFSFVLPLRAAEEVMT